jgi:hypothetical protein
VSRVQSSCTGGREPNEVPLPRDALTPFTLDVIPFGVVPVGELATDGTRSALVFKGPGVVYPSMLENPRHGALGSLPASAESQTSCMQK